MATFRVVPKGHALLKRKPQKLVYFKWLLLSIIFNIALGLSSAYLLLGR